MSENHNFHNHSVPDDFASENADFEVYGDYDGYDFEQESAPDEMPQSDPSVESDDTEQTIPYLPEDPAPDEQPQVRWTRGRIFYAMLVMLFVVVLVVYTLVPVIDHFINPRLPPVLPPPWMA